MEGRIFETLGQPDQVGRDRPAAYSRTPDFEEHHFAREVLLLDLLAEPVGTDVHLGNRGIGVGFALTLLGARP